MKISSLIIIVKTCFSIALIIGFSNQTAFGQILNFNSEGKGFNFDVEGLNYRDLVYYRFSDGHHFNVMSTPRNPNARVYREFTTGDNHKVVAYVARKNGSLDKASVNNGNVITPTITSNTTLPTFNFSNTGSNINLSTSWRPYINANSNLNSLQDDAVNSSFSTPNDEPWFFLNITLNVPANFQGGHAEVNFPDEHFDIDRIIIGENWGDFTNNQINTAVAEGSTFCTGAQYLEDQAKVKINIPANFQGQKNIYLMLKGTAPEQMVFTGHFYEQNNLMSSDNLELVASLNPHDPNRLSVGKCENEGECKFGETGGRDRASICTYQPSGELFIYLVEFENEGAGDALDIYVNIDFDENIFDLESVSIMDASHSLTETNINENQLEFVFFNINLPGLDDNSTSIEDTQGYFTFTARTHPCIDLNDLENLLDLDSELMISANTLFVGDQFEELTAINPVFHTIGVCENKEGEQCNDSDFRSNEISLHDINEESNHFSVQAYPTIFQSELSINISTPNPNQLVNIELLDITGQTVFSQTRHPSQKEVIDLSQLSSGIYILQIQQGIEIHKQKVIKH